MEIGGYVRLKARGDLRGLQGVHGELDSPRRHSLEAMPSRAPEKV